MKISALIITSIETIIIGIVIIAKRMGLTIFMMLVLISLLIILILIFLILVIKDDMISVSLRSSKDHLFIINEISLMLFLTPDIVHILYMHSHWLLTFSEACRIRIIWMINSRSMLYTA